MADLRGGIVRVVQSGDSNAGRIVGESLKSLRDIVGLTQKEMALRLGVGQAAVSKIERRVDVQISSLQKYVEALGATLRVEAAFPLSDDVVLDLRDAFDGDGLDEDQLALPILGDDVFRQHRDVVLSIRPQYCDKILDGRKTVELRRRFPVSAPKGAVAYIYSTSPVRAMVGSAEIANVAKLPVYDIWQQYSDLAFVEKADFDAYFAGLDEGFALEFSNIRPLPRAFDLPELRKRFGFEPPQSFLYAKPGLRRALQDEYSNVSY